MKLLLDACVWGPSLAELETAGHDVDWAGDWTHDPGDAQILVRAHKQGRVLVTLDKDFGELAVVHGLPHSGIVRLVGFRARDQGRICARVLERYGRDLAAGALVTVTPGRVRIRSSARDGQVDEQ